MAVVNTSKRGYARMGIVPFARILLASGDLDPVYVALNNTGWSRAKRLRWLVSYAAFYHCGVASYMCGITGDRFWAVMKVAAKNVTSSPAGGRWPRSKERRHFRGAQAVKAVADWSSRWPKPEDMFQYIAGTKSGVKFETVASRAREHRSVGPWLSFKIVDLVDACLGIEVNQLDLHPFLYDTPKESLLRVAQEEVGIAGTGQSEWTALERAIKYIHEGVEDLYIPHKPGCVVDMFCIETIACKHLSHLSGHYPVFNDIKEIREGLEPWLDTTRAARTFFESMPEEPNEDSY